MFRFLREYLFGKKKEEKKNDLLDDVRAKRHCCSGGHCSNRSTTQTVYIDRDRGDVIDTMLEIELAEEIARSHDIDRLEDSITSSDSSDWSGDGGSFSGAGASGSFDDDTSSSSDSFSSDD